MRRIFLDGMFFRSTGVGRIYENLLRMLLEQEWVEGIHTVIPASLEKKFRESFPGSRVAPVFVDYGPMSIGDLFRKTQVLDDLASHVSLFVFPGHNVPYRVPGEYVMTVHDLTVFSPHFRISRLRKAGFRHLLARSLSGAKKVIVVSETTREELVREFSLSAEKIVVIHNWIGEEFFLPEESRTSRKSPIAGDYLLYLGLRIAHKNLDGLVRAFLLLIEEYPQLRLVVAGRRYREPDMVDKWSGDSRLKDRLVGILDPTDEEMISLLAGAKIFVFPSLAEGFGLPPLEAMAAGTPVVCSDIPVFRKIYDDAVRYVNPHSPESIADGIRDLLIHVSLRDALVRKGREQAVLYRGDQSKKAYWELIHDLCGLQKDRSI